MGYMPIFCAAQTSNAFRPNSAVKGRAFPSGGRGPEKGEKPNSARLFQAYILLGLFAAGAHLRVVVLYALEDTAFAGLRIVAE